MKFISCRAEQGKDRVRDTHRGRQERRDEHSAETNSGPHHSVVWRCAQRYSLEECVLGAYAADGGMFLPAELPQLSKEQLQAWSKLDFQALVVEVSKG